MAFQVYKTGGSGFGNKFLIKICVTCYKGNVHQRTAALFNSGAEHLGGIQIIIQHICFCFVDLLHFLKTAQRIQPLQYQTQYIDAVAGRSVEHRIVFSMGGVAEHGGSDLLSLANQIFTNDNNGQTCGSHILLCACIDDTEFGYIYRLAENAGRHICNQRYITGIGQGGEFGTVNGVVHTDVEVICIFVKFGSIQLRNVAEGLVFGRSDHVALTVTASFFVCFLCPCACNYKISLFVLGHQVQGNHCKLAGSTAL